jgi:fucokinase
MHSAKEISRSDNALYRMRGYRVVAEILRYLKIDPLAELQIAATTENLDGSNNHPFTWSTFEDKAFRELSDLIQSHSLTVLSDECREFKYRHITVDAACRADFAGGWSDTPPFSIENGGVVLNCAISLNGKLPISVEARVLEEPRLILSSEDLNVRREFTHVGHILNYDDPSDPLALHKAALILTGIIPRDSRLSIRELFSASRNGLELITRADVPKGSGLGTSSILAGAVIVCLQSLVGRRLSEDDIFSQVLTLEQMLTIGGGWQDQVGGLVGGIKLIRSLPGVPQIPTYEEVVLPEDVREQFERQFVLVYTGQKRLAKRILRNIMGDYILRKKETVNIIHHIQEIALSIRNALVAGDFEQMGRLMTHHWELNKRLDPGSTNDFIDSVFRVCEPYVYGGKLCGAGGGGFVEFILRDAVSAALLNEVLKTTFPFGQVRVWPSGVEHKALEVVKTPFKN